MASLRTVLLAVAAVLLSSAAIKVNARDFTWTGASFDWPCATTKAMYKSGGKYIPKNIIATKALIFKDDAIVALPRFKPGVPATLAKISLKGRECQPALVPFPCWSAQEEGNCGALQNVVDAFLDPQDVLWVLDTGVVNSLAEPIRRCSPKVVAINAKSGKIVKIVDLGSLASASSRLQYLIADYSCDGRAFVYITDAATRAILVYDVTSGRGYRVVLPKAVTLGCAKRDVLYAALLRRPDGTSCLVFTYLSSTRLFSIRTDYLQNGCASGKIHDIGPKPPGKKMIILGTDNGTALFFRYEGEPDIYRWDSTTCYAPSSFQKVYSGGECSLPTSIAPDYKKSRMRVLESNFPDFIQGTVGCGPNHNLNLL